MTVTFDLTPDISRRLEALSAKSGLSRDSQLRLIIEQGLEDLEDLLEAEQVLARVRLGEEEVISGEAFWRGVDA